MAEPETVLSAAVDRTTGTLNLIAVDAVSTPHTQPAGDVDCIWSDVFDQSSGQIRYVSVGA